MTLTRDEKEYRAMLKQAKLLLQKGKLPRAEFFLQRAKECAECLPNGMKEAKLAFVWHRLAEVAVLSNEPTIANRRFRTALELADRSNALGYARIKRDYGEFLRRHGDPKAGRREVIAALELIEGMSRRSSRVRTELLVTEGFSARFDLSIPERRDDAVETLRVVATTLRGYSKPQYELAALRCLIEETSPSLSARAVYIQRAMILSIMLGNHRKAGEYLALLWGSPSRSLYNFIVR